jgi:hypothetical protein
MAVKKVAVKKASEGAVAKKVVKKKEAKPLKLVKKIATAKKKASK